MVWDGIIATYLFLAGLGAGAFALAALAGFVRPDAVKLRTIGYVIAPIAVGVGTVLLMVDAKAGLMNPLRFFGLLGNFSSIMAWGVVILVAFMAVSAIALVVMLVKKATPKALDVVGLVCAVAVAVYTGMLLGDAPGFPLWNPIVLPLLFLVSATSTGFAAVLLVAHLMKAEGLESLGFLRKAGLVLPVVEAVLIAALLGVVSGTGGSALITSPTPCTRQVPPIRAKGTSAPMPAPSAHSSLMESFAPYKAFSPTSTAAASALPPAIPARTGVFLWMMISTPANSPV